MVLPATLLRRLSRPARSEHGFTLVELLAVMVILPLVLTGVISLYLSGIRTQARLTASFQTQTSLHVGLDKMRKDVHLACSQTAQSATSVTLSLPPCDGTKMVTWCTQGSGSVYGLYRISGSTCRGRQARGLPHRRLDLQLPRAELAGKQLRAAAPARRLDRQRDADDVLGSISRRRRPGVPQRRAAIAAASSRSSSAWGRSSSRRSRSRAPVRC